MAITGPFISSTQVASSVPFDNTTGCGYSATDVQSALEELRKHTVYNSSTTATTASGTLTLVAEDNNYQFLTGTATGYSVKLPDATTLPQTAFYQVANTSNQSVAIKNNDGTTLMTLGQTSIAYIYLQTNGSAAGTWAYWQVYASATASGIVNYNITDTASFATTSSTDVAITSFNVTPEAGTYAVWVNGLAELSSSNANGTFTFYKDGAAVTDSLRTVASPGGGASFLLTTMTVTYFNGAQVAALYVLTSAGTFTITNRSMILIRIGA